MKQFDETAHQKLFQRLSLAEIFRQDVFHQQPEDSVVCNRIVALMVSGQF